MKTDASTHPDARRSAGCTPPATGPLLELARRLLSPKDWELWLLSEVERLEPGEVARRVGSDGASVRSSLQRIRARLVRELARLEDPPDGGAGRGERAGRWDRADE